MSQYLDRPTRRVIFPSNKELWADLYTDLTWADSKAFRDNDENDKNLFRLIKEWNVPELDLSYENLQLIKRIDINALFDAFNEIIDAEAETVAGNKKKETKSNSSKPPTSSPEVSTP